MPPMQRHVTLIHSGYSLYNIARHLAPDYAWMLVVPGQRIRIRIRIRIHHHAITMDATDYSVSSSAAS